MATKPTYNELERKIRQLEKEFLEYVRKVKELDKKRKVTERSHMRRTLSLMHFVEEQDREIKELKRSDTEEPELAFRWLELSQGTPPVSNDLPHSLSSNHEYCGRNLSRPRHKILGAQIIPGRY